MNPGLQEALLLIGGLFGMAVLAIAIGIAMIFVIELGCMALEFVIAVFECFVLFPIFLLASGTWRLLRKAWHTFR